MKAVYFEGANGMEVVEKEIPAEHLELANKKKKKCSMLFLYSVMN